MLRKYRVVQSNATKKGSITHLVVVANEEVQALRIAEGHIKKQDGQLQGILIANPLSMGECEWNRPAVISYYLCE